MSFGLKKALTIFLCFVVTQTAYASIPDGINWLTNHANPDGSYAIDTDISTAYQATAETLRSFQATGNTSEPGIPAALTYLDANTFHSTEYLSRNIIAGSEAGNSVTALTVELLTHQNPDGGFW
ncbi:MAG: hypothetical protein KZQ84_15395 [Candidatus Thiodiazotropha sp. (ex Lucinoma borealis)]|nr:hypothetical protein [Candidatus Thiodiazotropha sp. (ex Lucinoma borealis)]